MLPVLQLSSTGERQIEDAVEKLADKFASTDEERSALLPSGRQTTFNNRVHWAKSYPGKAGLVELTGRAPYAPPKGSSSRSWLAIFSISASVFRTARDQASQGDGLWGFDGERGARSGRAVMVALTA
jgi:restriction endonuclease Mrr